MLFNSQIFVLVFLPITLIGFFWISRTGARTTARMWLLAMSLVFYGWWSVIYVFLLVGLTIFTYLVGRWIGSVRGAGGSQSKWALRFGVAVLLGTLGYYKYITFFAGTLTALTGIDLVIEGVVLPLAISFFTFQMIAYLNDCFHEGEPGYSFAEFSLFIIFFPQLIAGPIVHHKELVPQLKSDKLGEFDQEAFAQGICFFVIGLLKKLVLADPLSELAAPMFAASDAGFTPGLFLGWLAAMAYGLGLYFDFSGYSDMAVGLARMFGIKLPYNFNSPYKSTSIIDFWRRWHITLSTFLRDYLYIPLGGNRKGETRRSANLMITMLLGGLWHGAGWTFVIWGGLHGLYLLINHSWNSFVKSAGERHWSRYMSGVPSHVLTLIAVGVAWVFFAAPTIGIAMSIFEGMIGVHGIGPVSPYEDGPHSMEILNWGLLVIGAAIVLWTPNSQEIVDGVRRTRPVALLTRVNFTPSMASGAILAAGLVFSLTLMADVKEFVYFQF